MLRVIQPFADHAVGDAITDAAEIEAVLASGNASFVVRVSDPQPEAAPKSTDKAKA